jgi:hypothetical protein
VAEQCTADSTALDTAATKCCIDGASICTSTSGTDNPLTYAINPCSDELAFNSSFVYDSPCTIYPFSGSETDCSTICGSGTETLPSYIYSAMGRCDCFFMTTADCNSNGKQPFNFSPCFFVHFPRAFSLHNRRVLPTLGYLLWGVHLLDLGQHCD